MADHESDHVGADANGAGTTTSDPPPLDSAPASTVGVRGSPTPITPGGVLTRRASGTPFEVHLDVFSGPFDLLLGLISKHKLDLTEIALAQVTDEFIAHIRAQQNGESPWDLSEASEFLLIAATLLDLKAARLLPTRRDGDDEDLALIEARDLLFARLLQYRAFKDIAAWVQERMAGPGRVYPRRANLEPRFRQLLPELVLGIRPDQLALIAIHAMTPTPPPTLGTAHLHEPMVNVREQRWIVSARLRAKGLLSFRGLVSDAESTLVIVARFLVLLELFQGAKVTFDQVEPLGELMIRWAGRDDPSDHDDGLGQQANPNEDDER